MVISGQESQPRFGASDLHARLLAAYNEQLPTPGGSRGSKDIFGERSSGRASKENLERLSSPSSPSPYSRSQDQNVTGQDSVSRTRSGSPPPLAAPAGTAQTQTRQGQATTTRRKLTPAEKELLARAEIELVEWSELQKNAAAVTVQAVYRGWNGRRYVKAKRARKKVEDAKQRAATNRRAMDLLQSAILKLEGGGDKNIVPGAVPPAEDADAEMENIIEEFDVALSPVAQVLTRSDIASGGDRRAATAITENIITSTSKTNPASGTVTRAATHADVEDMRADNGGDSFSSSSAEIEHESDDPTQDPTTFFQRKLRQESLGNAGARQTNVKRRKNKINAASVAGDGDDQYDLDFREQGERGAYRLQQQQLQQDEQQRRKKVHRARDKSLRQRKRRILDDEDSPGDGGGLYQLDDAPPAEYSNSIAQQVRSQPSKRTETRTQKSKADDVGAPENSVAIAGPTSSSSGVVENVDKNRAAGTRTRKPARPPSSRSSSPLIRSTRAKSENGDRKQETRENVVATTASPKVERDEVPGTSKAIEQEQEDSRPATAPAFGASPLLSTRSRAVKVKKKTGRRGRVAGSGAEGEQPPGDGGEGDEDEGGPADDLNSVSENTRVDGRKQHPDKKELEPRAEVDAVVRKAKPRVPARRTRRRDIENFLAGTSPLLIGGGRTRSRTDTKRKKRNYDHTLSTGAAEEAGDEEEEEDAAVEEASAPESDDGNVDDYEQKVRKPQASSEKPAAAARPRAETRRRGTTPTASAHHTPTSNVAKAGRKPGPEVQVGSKRKGYLERAEVDVVADDAKAGERLPHGKVQEPSNKPAAVAGGAAPRSRSRKSSSRPPTSQVHAAAASTSRKTKESKLRAAKRGVNQDVQQYEADIPDAAVEDAEPAEEEEEEDDEDLATWSLRKKAADVEDEDDEDLATWSLHKKATKAGVDRIYGGASPTPLLKKTRPARVPGGQEDHDGDGEDAEEDEYYDENGGYGNAYIEPPGEGQVEKDDGAAASPGRWGHRRHATSSADKSSARTRMGGAKQRAGSAGAAASQPRPKRPPNASRTTSAKNRAESSASRGATGAGTGTGRRGVGIVAEDDLMDNLEEEDDLDQVQDQQRPEEEEEEDDEDLATWSLHRKAADVEDVEEENQNVGAAEQVQGAPHEIRNEQNKTARNELAVRARRGRTKRRRRPDRSEKDEDPENDVYEDFYEQNEDVLDAELNNDKQQAVADRSGSGKRRKTSGGARKETPSPGELGNIIKTRRDERRAATETAGRPARTETSYYDVRRPRSPEVNVAATTTSATSRSGTAAGTSGARARSRSRSIGHEWPETELPSFFADAEQEVVSFVANARERARRRGTGAAVADAVEVGGVDEDKKVSFSSASASTAGDDARLKAMRKATSSSRSPLGGRRQAGLLKEIEFEAGRTRSRAPELDANAAGVDAGTTSGGPPTAGLTFEERFLRLDQVLREREDAQRQKWYDVLLKTVAEKQTPPPPPPPADQKPIQVNINLTGQQLVTSGGQAGPQQVTGVGLVGGDGAVAAGANADRGRSLEEDVARAILNSASGNDMRAVQDFVEVNDTRPTLTKQQNRVVVTTQARQDAAEEDGMYWMPPSSPQGNSAAKAGRNSSFRNKIGERMSSVGVDFMRQNKKNAPVVASSSAKRSRSGSLSPTSQTAKKEQGAPPSPSWLEWAAAAVGLGPGQDDEMAKLDAQPPPAVEYLSQRLDAGEKYSSSENYSKYSSSDNYQRPLLSREEFERQKLAQMTNLEFDAIYNTNATQAEGEFHVRELEDYYMRDQSGDLVSDITNMLGGGPRKRHYSGEVASVMRQLRGRKEGPPAAASLEKVEEEPAAHKSPLGSEAYKRSPSPVSPYSPLRKGPFDNYAPRVSAPTRGGTRTKFFDSRKFLSHADFDLKNVRFEFNRNHFANYDEPSGAMRNHRRDLANAMRLGETIAREVESSTMVAAQEQVQGLLEQSSGGFGKATTRGAAGMDLNAPAVELQRISLADDLAESRTLADIAIEKTRDLHQSYLYGRSFGEYAAPMTIFEGRTTTTIDHSRDLGVAERDHGVPDESSSASGLHTEASSQAGHLGEGGFSKLSSWLQGEKRANEVGEMLRASGLSATSSSGSAEERQGSQRRTRERLRPWYEDDDEDDESQIVDSVDRIQEILQENAQQRVLDEEEF